MRKIVHAPARHNGGRSLALGLGALLILMAGCGGGEKDVVVDTCQVAVDTTAWPAFLALADRMDSGREVPPAEKEAFADQPTVALWRRGLAPHIPTPLNVGNWLDAAFAAAGAERGRTKQNANRRMLSDSYRYSFANRAEVDSLLADFRNEGACRLARLTDAWIDPAKLPATGLAVSFLPAQAEIRLTEDTLLVDTGVLVAGGLEQAVDQMASLLYRNYQTIDGPVPNTLTGAEALAHVFRIVTNEGVAGWIARTLDTEFRTDHPRLGDIGVIPESYYQTARRVQDLADRMLPGMFADPQVMESSGLPFTNFLVGQNAFSPLGYGMASVIVTHHGEERLKEVAHSVPGFLAAYQEAALLNPAPHPVPGNPGTSLPETMRPFPDEVFTALMGLLQATFPPE